MHLNCFIFGIDELQIRVEPETGVALAKIRAGRVPKTLALSKVLKSSNIRLPTRAGSVSRYWSLYGSQVFSAP
jgi:hypothetical protein